MSWDHELKSIKFPCGKGTIEKDTRSDDWGRYEEGRHTSIALNVRKDII